MQHNHQQNAREAWADFMSCLMCLPSTEWAEFEEKMAEHLNRTYGAYRAEKRAEYVTGERLDQILGQEVDDANCRRHASRTGEKLMTWFTKQWKLPSIAELLGYVWELILCMVTFGVWLETVSLFINKYGKTKTVAILAVYILVYVIRKNRVTHNAS